MAHHTGGGGAATQLSNAALTALRTRRPCGQVELPESETNMFVVENFLPSAYELRAYYDEK